MRVTPICPLALFLLFNLSQGCIAADKEDQDEPQEKISEDNNPEGPKKSPEEKERKKKAKQEAKGIDPKELGVKQYEAENEADAAEGELAELTAKIPGGMPVDEFLAETVPARHVEGRGAESEFSELQDKVRAARDKRDDANAKRDAITKRAAKFAKALPAKKASPGEDEAGPAKTQEDLAKARDEADRKFNEFLDKTKKGREALSRTLVGVAKALAPPTAAGAEAPRTFLGSVAEAIRDPKGLLDTRRAEIEAPTKNDGVPGMKRLLKPEEQSAGVFSALGSYMSAKPDLNKDREITYGFRGAYETADGQGGKGDFQVTMKADSALAKEGYLARREASRTNPDINRETWNALSLERNGEVLPFAGTRNTKTGVYFAPSDSGPGVLKSEVAVFAKPSSEASPTREAAVLANGVPTTATVLKDNLVRDGEISSSPVAVTRDGGLKGKAQTSSGDTYFFDGKSIVFYAAGETLPQAKEVTKVETNAAGGVTKIQLGDGSQLEVVADGVVRPVVPPAPRRKAPPSTKPPRFA